MEFILQFIASIFTTSFESKPKTKSNILQMD